MSYAKRTYKDHKIIKKLKLELSHRRIVQKSAEAHKTEQKLFRWQENTY